MRRLMLFKGSTQTQTVLTVAEAKDAQVSGVSAMGIADGDATRRDAKVRTTSVSTSPSENKRKQPTNWISADPLQEIN